MNLEQLKYPIGRFTPQETITQKEIEIWIDEIETLPSRLNAMVVGISEKTLDTPYRPDGWTVRQVVHHLVDSHINSYIRFRWALTEDKPVIKAYNEKAWAELPDAKFADVVLSLKLLEALHARWTVLLKAMSQADMEKVFIHPDSGRELKLARVVGLYAWHGNHHLAHIIKLLQSL